MFVSNQMSKNPITIESTTTLDVAKTVMKKNGFRRLPVVDEGQLVGFVTDGDLKEVSPSPATTLSRYEITDLLAKMTVKDIMKREVITIAEDATIEEAALLMVQHKIEALPVLSELGSVVGIITETDIFHAFVQVMGLTEGKTRITVQVKNQYGTVRDLSAIFADHGWNIDSLVTVKHDADIYDIIIRTSVDDMDTVRRAIEEKGFTVIHVVKIGS